MAGASYELWSPAVERANRPAPDDHSADEGEENAWWNMADDVIVNENE